MTAAKGDTNGWGVFLPTPPARPETERAKIVVEWLDGTRMVRVSPGDSTRFVIGDLKAGLPDHCFIDSGERVALRETPDSGYENVRLFREEPPAGWARRPATRWFVGAFVRSGSSAVVLKAPGSPAGAWCGSITTDDVNERRDFPTPEEAMAWVDERLEEAPRFVSNVAEPKPVAVPGRPLSAQAKEWSAWLRRIDLESGGPHEGGLINAPAPVEIPPFRGLPASAFDPLENSHTMRALQRRMGTESGPGISALDLPSPEPEPYPKARRSLSFNHVQRRR